MANRGVDDKFVYLLVVFYDNHELSWHDCLLIVLCKAISRQFEDFNGEVIDDGGQEDVDTNAILL